MVFLLDWHGLRDQRKFINNFEGYKKLKIIFQTFFQIIYKTNGFDSDRTECLAQIYDPRIRPWLKGYLYDHLDGILDIVIGKH